MYPLPLLVGILHIKWQPFLFNKTWKTQYIKVKYFSWSVSCWERVTGMTELEKSKNVSGMSFLPIYTFTNTWVMAGGQAGIGWGGECFHKANGKNYARIHLSLPPSCRIASGEYMRLWLPPIPKHPGTTLLLLHMALVWGVGQFGYKLYQKIEDKLKR